MTVWSCNRHWIRSRSPFDIPRFLFFAPIFPHFFVFSLLSFHFPPGYRYCRSRGCWLPLAHWRPRPVATVVVTTSAITPSTEVSSATAPTAITAAPWAVPERITPAPITPGTSGATKASTRRGSRATEAAASTAATTATETASLATTSRWLDTKGASVYAGAIHLTASLACVTFIVEFYEGKAWRVLGNPHVVEVAILGKLALEVFFEDALRKTADEDAVWLMVTRWSMLVRWLTEGGRNEPHISSE